MLHIFEYREDFSGQIASNVLNGPLKGFLVPLKSLFHKALGGRPLGLRDVLKVNIIGSSINGPCYQIPPWHHVFLLYCLLTQYKDLFINKTHTFFIFF